MTRDLLFIALALMAVVRAARAEPARSMHEARMLSASSNAPIFAIHYLGSARGRFAGQIPFWGALDAERGFFLKLVPLMELKNGDDDRVFMVPWATWRGRVTLEGGWKWPLGRSGRSLVALTLGVEHESDHPTGPSSNKPFDSEGVVDNDVLLRIDYVWEGRWLAVTSTLTQRLHFLTCWDAEANCHAGDNGSRGYEVGVEVVADFGAKSPFGLRPFVSGAAAYLVGGELIMQRGRLWLKGGLRWRSRHLGLWQLFAQLLVGDDVGIPLRSTQQIGVEHPTGQLVRGGFGLGWGW